MVDQIERALRVMAASPAPRQRSCRLRPATQTSGSRFEALRPGREPDRAAIAPHRPSPAAHPAGSRELRGRSPKPASIRGSHRRASTITIMHVSRQTLNAMVDVATGDVIGPYRTHADLNALLGQYGFQNDGLLTRRDFVLQRGRQAQWNPGAKGTHPRTYPSRRGQGRKAARRRRRSSQPLLVLRRLRDRIRATRRACSASIERSVVDFPDPLRGSNDDARQFLEEQREKCDQKDP